MIEGLGQKVGHMMTLFSQASGTVEGLSPDSRRLGRTSSDFMNTILFSLYYSKCVVVIPQVLLQLSCLRKHEFGVASRFLEVLGTPGAGQVGNTWFLLLGLLGWYVTHAGMAAVN